MFGWTEFDALGNGCVKIRFLALSVPLLFIALIMATIGGRPTQRRWLISDGYPDDRA